MATGSTSPEPEDRASGMPARLAPMIGQARELIGQWEMVARPEGPPDWFSGSDSMPAFDPGFTGFSPSNAWWLAELCRIAYTPDAKEAGRRWHRDKPDRQRCLQECTPFRETLNLHKTGNHVSLYEIGDKAGSILCFRGTNKFRQWVMNLTALPRSWPMAGEGEKVCVHHGFQLLFDRVWPLVEPHLAGCPEPLFVTGHSLGGAFATLASAMSPTPPAALITLGSPRVGNRAFVESLRNLPIHRIVHHHDIVPLLPQRDSRLGVRDYVHAGDLIYLDDVSGVAHLQPGPEDPEDPDWKPADPVAFLRSSLGNPEPPECVRDHTPALYSEKLRALVARGDGK